MHRRFAVYLLLSVLGVVVSLGTIATLILRWATRDSRKDSPAEVRQEFPTGRLPLSSVCSSWFKCVDDERLVAAKNIAEIENNFWIGTIQVQRV